MCTAVVGTCVCVCVCVCVCESTSEVTLLHLEAAGLNNSACWDLIKSEIEEHSCVRSSSANQKRRRSRVACYHDVLSLSLNYFNCRTFCASDIVM